VSTPVESVWANPKEVLQAPHRLPELATALGIPQDVLTQRIAQRADKEFVYLRRHMNPDEAEAIVALGAPGVFSQREFRRFYPVGEITAHVLGFTNIDDSGQEGLELAFDEWLTGKPGAKRVIRDRRGRIVENVDLIRASEPGRDLALSLDRRIQYLAYRELKTALLENQASSGSVVVLEVGSGEILAMVNQPSYNPNSREGSEPGTHRNRAVTDVFEPGSVMKTLTVAAAMEAGKFRSDTPIDTTPG
jgi:cell division protein FtsI (penicillin-binding protein 3)